jgi:glutathione synthase/RimK-type ligase-like ATP-grasp enzyme
LSPTRFDAGVLRNKFATYFPDEVRDLVRAVRLHRTAHGQYPRLWRPRTFNEWIARRKVFDRRPLFRTFADKYAVRQFVARHQLQDILPELYCIEARPEHINFDFLPQRFVVKPTHGSGWVRVVHDKDSLDRAELLRTCQKWLDSDFYAFLREPQYKGVPRRIMIEEFIDDGSGESPRDYKFFVFNGRVQLIQIDGDRFAGHRRSLYTRDWRDTGVRFHYERIEAPVPKPPHHELMVQIAEQLSEGLDFIRVDLYDTDHQVYFGEMTATPGCGLDRFEPAAMDEKLGDLWRNRSRCLEIDEMPTQALG